MKENEVGKFLRLLTHDLQNQLGAIDLNLQIMPTLVDERDETMKTFEPFLDRATLASSDMIDTLQDIQSFARSVSRTDEGGSPIEIELTACDLAAKVRDCAMILAGAARHRSVRLTTSVTEGIFAPGEVDSIRRSIKILASEALRSSFPDSTVDMKVFAHPVPTIEIATSQEGVFEENRPMLSLYLVRQLLETSRATILFLSSENRSAVQLLFPPA